VPRPADLDEERQRDEETADRRVALMTRVLTEESVDRGWARGAEDALGEAARSPELSGSRVTALECRSTICRIDVEHESFRAAERWTAVFALRIATVSVRAMERRYHDAGGVRRSTMFVARTGHRLPEIEQHAGD